MVKKILIISSRIDRGGAQRAALLYLDGFLQNGHDCRLFSVRQHSTDSRIIYQGNGRVANSFASLVYVLRSFKPDVILSTQNYLNLFVILACYFLRIDKRKLLLREANTLTSYSLSMTLIVRYIYPKNAINLAITEEIERELINHGRKKIVTFPNPESNNVKFESRFDLGRKSFVYIGRLKRSKRVKEIVDFLETSAIDCRLKIIGDGADYACLQSMKARLKHVNIELLGYIDKWAEEISDEDCMLYNSEYEGYPNVLSEFLALGLPVVSSDFSGGGFQMLSKYYSGLFDFDFENGTKDCFLNILSEVSKFRTHERSAYLNAEYITRNILIRCQEKY